MQTGKKWIEYLKKHKYACVIVFLVLIFIIYLGVDHVSNKKIGLSVVFKGLYYGETKQISTDINREVDSIGKLDVELIKLGKKIESSKDFSYATKSSTFLATNSVDVYLVDKFNYDQLSNKEVLADLSKIAEQNNIEKKRLFYINDKVLGINVKDSKLLNKVNIRGNDFIVVMIKNTKRYKNAVKFIKQLL